MLKITIVLLLVGVVTCAVVALVTILRAPEDTLNDYRKVIFEDVGGYALAGFVISYIFLFYIHFSKSPIKKETGLAIQYVSVLLGLTGLIGVTSILSDLAHLRSVVISHNMASTLTVAERSAHLGTVDCSSRDSGLPNGDVPKSMRSCNGDRCILKWRACLQRMYGNV
jgi:hypothetical protein